MICNICKWFEKNKNFSSVSEAIKRLLFKSRERETSIQVLIQTTTVLASIVIAWLYAAVVGGISGVTKFLEIPTTLIPAPPLFDIVGVAADIIFDSLIESFDAGLNPESEIYAIASAYGATPEMLVSILGGLIIASFALNYLRTTFAILIIILVTILGSISILGVVHTEANKRVKYNLAIGSRLVTLKDGEQVLYSNSNINFKTSERDENSSKDHESTDALVLTCITKRCVFLPLKKLGQPVVSLKGQKYNYVWHQNDGLGYFSLDEKGPAIQLPLAGKKAALSLRDTTPFFPSN